MPSASHRFRIATAMLVISCSSFLGCDKQEPAPAVPVNTVSGSNAAAPVVTPAIDPIVRSHYHKLAGAIADSTLATLTPTSAVSTDPSEALAAAHSRIQALFSIEGEDKQIQYLAEQAITAQRGILDGQQRLAAPSDDGFGALVVGLLGLYLGMPSALLPAAQDVLSADQAERSVQLQWIQAYQQHRATQLLLIEQGRRFAGPNSTSSPPIAIDFFESWGGITPYDGVSLTNSSGQTLNNCLVMVEVRGSNGDSRRNVHFIPVWSAGEPRYALYGPGTTYSGQAIGQQTVYGVESVTTSMWCDELHAESNVYLYVGSEREKDVQYLIENVLKFQANLVDTGILQTVYSLELTLTDLPILPECSIEIIASSGRNTLSKSFDIPQWHVGQSKRFEIGRARDIHPENVEFLIRFPGIAYVRKRSMTFNTQ